jgi:hypothetical protein
MRKPSEVYSIVLSGAGDRWQRTTNRVSENGGAIVKADFDLAPFLGCYCRVTAVDRSGRRAWSSPIWP